MTRDRAEVLFANDAFYSAFSHGDFPAMEKVWSQGNTISCIHPGGPLMHGRGEVMASWRAILEGHASDGVTAAAATAMVLGEMAWVTCLEGFGNGYLAATNIFAREIAGWRMVHHQAGPTTVLSGEAPARHPPATPQ